MRKWMPLVAVCLAAFLLIVDTTVVTVALPELARGLGSSLADLQWVTNGYPLALAVFSLSAGSVADLFGPRRVFLCATGVFGAASLLCGLAPGTGTLVLGRALQGVGASAVFVTGMALLGTYRDRERATAIGVWSAVVGAAAAAGPLVGGLLTQFLGWRAIFFVNVPVAALTIGLALRYTTAAPRLPAGRPDLPGMFWFAVCAGTLTCGLIRAGESGWSVATAVLLGLSALALSVLVRVERRSPRPVLDLVLFRDTAFLGILLCVVASATAFAALVYLSLWLQDSRGLGPAGTGLTLLPMAVTSFLVSTAAGKVLHRVPPRLTLAAGSLLLGKGFLLAWLSLPLGLVVVGAGVGLSVPATSSAVLAAVPPERAGLASGALATVRQLGQVLGVAVLGLVFRDAGIVGVLLVSAGLALLTSGLGYASLRKVASRSRLVSSRD
ncbi:EmrB/QacA subfamily drug resistance transporter [Crossiella equi]|uniref:EmrB/QacA subfamily drug resistance transporter n=1 Tax=Crossiella equi TaxID=130796 RepID=A0ABS5ARC6_9PSEU|nr:MFS transporter [Crossiella equi]MBP2478986.1 EmrB/QacA subfamily drug resistance transporter [Crossiella equi]